MNKVQQVVENITDSMNKTAKFKTELTRYKQMSSDLIVQDFIELNLEYNKLQTKLMAGLVDLLTQMNQKIK